MANLINSLDLNLLKVFREIYLTKSTTQAADKLGMTQSAISRALHKLRTNFDDELFLWQRNEMQPTLTANRVIGDIEVALEAVEAALASIKSFEPKNAEITFYVGTTDYVILALVGRLLEHMQKVAPHCTLVLRPIATTGAVHALMHGEVEFVLTSSHVDDPLVASTHLFSDDFVVIGDRADLPHSGSTLPLSDYLNANHALCSVDGHTAGWVDTALDKIGEKRDVRAVFFSFSPMLSALRGSTLLATVPRELARSAKTDFGLHVWELPFQSDKHDFHLVYLEKNKPSPSSLWFRKLLLAKLKNWAKNDDVDFLS